MSVVVLKTSLRFERPPEGVRTDQLSTMTVASAIGAPEAESTTVPACAWRTTSCDATHAEAVTAKAAIRRSVQLFKTTLPQAFVSPTSAQRDAGKLRTPEAAVSFIGGLAGPYYHRPTAPPSPERGNASAASHVATNRPR